jgi:hypothetical protein
VSQDATGTRPRPPSASASAITADDVLVPGSLQRVTTAANPDLTTLNAVATAAVPAGSHAVKVIGDRETMDAALGWLQFASFVATALGA